MLTLVLSAMLVLAACTGDPTGSGSDSVVGTYTLKSVATRMVPAVFAGGVRMEVKSGSFVLNEDQTFNSSIDYRITNGTVVTESPQRQTGTYRRKGNAMTLRYSDGSEDAASISGQTLTVRASGFNFVFEREI